MRPLLLLTVLVSLASAEDAWPPIATGEFWYRAVDGDGKTEGFMRLTVERPEGGGLKTSWELRVSYPGGSYEETRSMELGAKGELAGASLKVEGGPEGEVRGGEGSYTGRGRAEAGADWTLVKLEGRDLAGGMPAFVALTRPRKPGAEVTLTELTLGGPPAKAGPLALRGGKLETVAPDGLKLEAWRFEAAREGTPTVLWVTEDGTVAQVEWGGGSRLLLSSKPTRDLFVKQEAAVKDVSAGPERLVVQGEFPGFTPEEMFEQWTKPELVKSWWAPEAEIGDAAGGPYVLRWPAQKWTLRGKILAWEPGKALGFTWRWDHEPKDKAEVTARVALEAIEGGTRVTITHGPYADGAAGRQEREGHLEGWKLFCARLRALRAK
jgi:uncharacterized protein YndB with AHSA1/START domain